MAAVADGHLRAMAAGRVCGEGRSSASGSSSGIASRWSRRFFWRNLRNEYAVANSRSAAAIGSSPLLSTASRRIGIFAAAAVTMEGRKNVGKSSVTTTAASADNASSSPRPAPLLGST
jgi:hypothetical protein